MQVEFTAVAYKMHKWESVEQMLKGEKMPYVCDHDFDGCPPKDWVKLGTARVIVEFDDNETIVATQIDALKAALHSVRAENHMREKQILDQIANLEAITYNPTN